MAAASRSVRSVETLTGPPEPDVLPPKGDGNLGRVIDGRYVIERLIGSGGMGAVYLARHKKLGRRVAVKLIHDELAHRPDVVSRFEREVEANARLEHPHIANAIDCGTEDDGATYLVMQLVDGLPLRDVMAEGPVAWRRVCAIGAQIADALAAAHAAGVVHRDLKPGNVILEKTDRTDDHVRVLDFGIAALLDEAARPTRPLTREGHVVGTIGYMAPEQALARDVTAPSDVYSLGVLLWEMIAGEQLFERRELTISSYIVSQLTEPAPRLETGPAELADLVSRMLVAEVGERVSSAEEVRDALLRLAQAEEPAEETPALATIAPPAMDEAPATPPPPRPRRGPRLFELAVGPAAAILAGAVALVGALGSVDAPPSFDKGKLAKAKPVEPARVPQAVAAPDPLVLALDALVRPDDDWRVRREAARLLMEHPDEVTLFAFNAARVEIAANCEVRVQAARQLIEEADPRAEGVLRRRRRDRCRSLRNVIEEGLRELR